MSETILHKKVFKIEYIKCLKSTLKKLFYKKVEIIYKNRFKNTIHKNSLEKIVLNKNVVEEIILKKLFCR